MTAVLGWLTPRRIVLLLIAAAALAVALVLLWYFALRGDPPPPASLQAAVESVREQEAAQEQASQPAAADDGVAQDQETQSGGGVGDADSGGAPDDAPSAAANPGSDAQETQSAAADPGSDAQQPEPAAQQQESEPQQQEAPQDEPQDAEQTVSSEPPSLAELTGVWTLSERGESFVGYRIDEELANIGAATAVGRTGDVTATLEFDGAAVTSVEIVADLRTLRSDQGFRDGALRTRGLESDTYPFATFRLAEPIPIERLPLEGDALAVTAIGTLELHGVTNEVEIALEGQYVDGLVVVSGSTEIVLTDYEIEAPTGFRVLSIAEAGLMEFQIILEQGG